MDKYYSFNIHHYIVIIFFSIFLINCSESNKYITGPNQNSLSFPNFFIEQGSDSDTSYISLKGEKIENDIFLLQASSWGIVEYGLFLNINYIDNLILLKMMGTCGTVSSRTWEKVTLSKRITSEEFSTIQKFSFTNFRDTISIVKTTIF